MKRLLPLLLLLPLLGLLLKVGPSFFSETAAGTSSNQIPSTSTIETTQPKASRELPPLARAKALIHSGDNKGEFDPELVALLAEHEAEILAYLNTIQYEEVESTEDPNDPSNELLKITKALYKHFEGLSFAAKVIKLDALEDSPEIQNSVIQRLLNDARANPDDYESIYQWALAHPESLAAQHSGAQLGGALAAQHADDLPTAWQRAQALPAGGSRAEALVSVLSQVWREDITAAGELLNATPPSPALDHAIDYYVDYALSVADENQQPDTLFQWSTSISDPQLRFQSLTQVLESWHNSDPTALQAHLKTLPPDLQTEASLALKQIMANNLPNQR